MAINFWNEHGSIKASYRANGELQIRTLAPAEYTAFVKAGTSFDALDRHPDFPGWERLTFLDYNSRKEPLENNPGILYEADVSPVRRFITDHHCKLEPPRRCYLDIETDSRVPFSEAIFGKTTLLSWALVDEEGHRRAAVLEDWHEQAEAELWAALWSKMGDYDQISAWNGERFDFAVMKSRCEDLAKRFSRTLEPFWEHRRRLLFVDHMLAFKRHHMAAESGDEKTSLRLGDVCEAILGEGKNDFDSGQTYEAWIAGGASRQALLDYNLQDTALLPKLEEATGYLGLQQAIAEITLCPVNTHTLKPMPWIDAYLLKMAHKRQTHLPSKMPGGGDIADVQGAIVMAPTKLGIHTNVHVCDFKSLYPTIIRTWNLGSETKVDDGPCESPTGVRFRTDAQSMLSQFCEDMMNYRDQYKKEMKNHPPGTPAWKNAERLSKGAKIANNSGFGVTGNPFFRLYDPEITSAIIQGARTMLIATKEAAEVEGKEMIYGDTDSLFIIGGSKEEFEAFVGRCNREVFPKVLEKHGCRPEHRCVELAYEKQFARLVFPLGTAGSASARRYAGSYSHYGGKAATADSKPEIRGLEFMRTDGTRIARRLQREAIEMILRTDVTANEMHEWVKRKRELFFDGEVPLEDIVLSKGINRPLDMYKVKPPHVRIAEALAETGEDVGEGTRISYVVVDGSVSPVQVIPASEYTGTFDRFALWNKAVYPPLLRVLAGAFPMSNWQRWIAKRPKPTLPGQLSLTYSH